MTAQHNVNELYRQELIADAKEEWLIERSSRDANLADTFKDANDDINHMHRKFGVHPIIQGLPDDLLAKFLTFRMNFLKEEYDEGEKAIIEGNADDLVDAHIDLIVIALGTLDLFGVNFHEAWYRVHRANMEKIAGANPQRPNAFGAPDLIKPEGWTAPSHADNVGIFPRALKQAA